MEGEVEQPEEFMDVLDTLEEEGEVQVEVSLNALLGLSTSSEHISTITIVGYAGKLPMTILIDSGSTHSFVDPHIVKLLRLPAQPMQRPMRITVANEQLMSCQLESPSFGWRMQGEQFNFKMRLIKVGGCDMIFEMDWIDMVAPVILHTRPHNISFMTNGKLITLYGIQKDLEVTPMDTKILRRMLQRGTYEIVAELSLISDSMDNQEKEVMHPCIKKLLQNHAAIFHEPKELPPERTCDHAINLVPRAQPFNLRSYKYSFDQKNAFESIIKKHHN
ncbi:hypothetical protein KY285_010996 [Solanum tuberosum]|nr:hypothetical protein KY285_010996 [Solanum tuberosum]